VSLDYRLGPFDTSGLGLELRQGCPCFLGRAGLVVWFQSIQLAVKSRAACFSFMVSIVVNFFRLLTFLLLSSNVANHRLSRAERDSSVANGARGYEPNSRQPWKHSAARVGDCPNQPNQNINDESAPKVPRAVS
jgi:hypothetical protein